MTESQNKWSETADISAVRALERAVGRFENAWQSGSRPSLDEFLPADLDKSLSSQVLLELVHVDLEYRLKAGEPARVEEYLSRYPRLSGDGDTLLGLIESEYKLRVRVESDLSPDDYNERFPEHQAELSIRLKLPTRRRRFPIRLHCPHCHNPIAIVDDEPEDDVVCASCGSSFRLDADTNVSWSQKKLPKINKFELQEAVGRGAFGTVYRAIDTELGRTVAIKVPRCGTFASEEDEDRFVREARSVAQLAHPGIVAVHDVGRNESYPYIVSEYVSGMTLADFLKNHQLSFRRSAELIKEVAEALQHCHDHGVFHRDLKPTNIMLAKEGRRPRLMDFGLARREAGEITMTLEGQILGTPAYMSPEQASGRAHDAQAPSDVYSLGVILYELLTSSLPFAGTRHAIIQQHIDEEPRAPRRVNERIPRDLETITLKCLHKDPGRRYQTAAELNEDLNRWLSGEPITARPVTWMERTWRWCRRQPAMSALSAAVVVLLLGLAIGGPLLARNAEEARQQAEELKRQAVAARNEETRLRTVATDNAAEAERERNTAERMRKKAEQQVYLSDMREVQREWRDFNIGSMRALLDKHKTDEDSIGFAWRFWDSRSKGDIRTLTGHEKAVSKARYSPNGKWLASCSGDGTVKVWDPASGELIHSLEEHTNRVSGVAFSPDSRRLASTGRDRSVRLWDTATGKPIRTFIGHRRRGNHVAFNKDGRQLASASSDGTVIVWQVETGEVHFTLRGHTDSVTMVEFSPDGKRLATSSADNTVKLWDAETRQVLHTFIGQELTGRTVYYTSVAFSPDGAQLAAASRDGTLKLWDVASHNQLRVFEGHDDLVNSVAFSPDGKRLVSAGADNTIRVWDLATAGQLRIIRGHTADAVSSVEFSPDGLRLASAGGDATVKVWDARHGQEPLTLSSPLRAELAPGEIGSSVRSVAFSPDGKRLAAASWGTSVKVCDLQTGTTIRRLKGPKGLVTHVVFGRLGKRLAAIGRATSTDVNSIIVWDADTGDTVFSVEEPVEDPGRFYVPAVALNRDATRVAAAGSNHTVKLWDVESGKQLKALTGHTASVESVAYSQDGKHLASGGWDGTAIIWDAISGQPIHEIKPITSDPSFVRCVAFSPDGTQLVRCAENEPVTLWDVQTGKRIQTFSGHSGTMTAAFSPDGRQLASAGSGKTVRVWDVKTAARILTLRGHTQEIFSVAFSPDGQRLASASLDQKVIVWGGELPVQPIEIQLGESEVAQVWLQRGAKHGYNGEADKSLAFIHKAIAIYRRLVDAQPGDPGPQSDLADAYRVLGSTQQRLAAVPKATVERKDAVASYGTAIDILRNLVQFHPQTAEYQSDLAGTYNGYAILQENMRNHDDAVAAYRQSIEAFRRLVETHPQIPKYARNLSRTHHNLADLQEKIDQPDEALGSFQQAIVIRERLVAEHPKSSVYQADLANAYVRLGRLQGELNREDEAVGSYRKAIAIHQRLAAAHPDEVEHRFALGQTYNNLGLLQGRNDKTKQSLVSIGEAIDIYRQLVDQRPEISVFSVVLAGTHTNLGSQLIDVDRSTEALEHYAAAIQLLDKVRRLDNRDARATRYLRNTYWGRARCMTRLARYAAALDDWDRAIQLNPATSSRTRGSLRMLRARTQALDGQHAAATSEVEKLLKLGPVSSGTLYNAACVFALSSQFVSDNESLPVADRKQLAERYAARAVALLTQAGESGFFKDPQQVTEMCADDDLETLRTREDYRQFVEQLKTESTSTQRSPRSEGVAFIARGTTERREISLPAFVPQMMSGASKRVFV